MKMKSTAFQPRPRLGLGILGVLIALSAPIVQRLLGPWFKSTFEFPMDRFVSLWNFWIAMIIVLAIAHFAEGYPLAAFGFQRSKKTLRTRLIEWILAVLGAPVVVSVIVLFSTYVRGLITNEPAPSLAAVRLLPWWVLIPAWITGSLTEEVLFRSYPIERLTQMTGQPWLAGLISVLAFTLLHLFGWDWIHVLTAVLPGGILLTLIYMWRRNLAMNVLLHAVINAPLLLLPLLEPFM
jgi:uncharacterized protein